MRWLQSVLAVGIVSLGMFGCSDDDDEPGDSAAELCEDVLTAICLRTVECAPPAAPVTQDECLSARRASLKASGTNCGEAFRVRSSYDQCLSELPAHPCADVTGTDTARQLPASCVDVIELRPD